MNILAIAGLLAIQGQAKVETDWGLHTATFDTLYGKVVVYLPEGMAAGDTIGGTVIAQPKGSTPEERQANEDQLNGLVIAAPGLNASAKTGRFRWEVPAAIGAAALLTCGSGGGGGGGQSVPVSLNPAPGAPPAAITLPPIGQAGRPVVCPGPFDGNVLNTSVTLGDAPVAVIAESPRQAVFSCPTTPGAGQLEIREGPNSATGTFNALSVRLRAGQSTLRPGETTQVSCTVTGFEGAPASAFPVGFEMRDLTPNTAVFEGIPGNIFSHSIRREDVQNGTYTFNASLVGLSPGAFNISAKVLWFWPWGKKDKTEENPLMKKPPTPEESPYHKCCWLITVGPGEGAADVDHSAVSIDGKVYSFEGNGMNVYPNTGAYLNKRKFEDGRQVWVNPVTGVDKDAMRKKAQEIIDAGKKYDLFTNNCALNAAALLEAGGKKDLLKEVKPLRLKNRNENTGEIGKSTEIKDKQVE
jgi:hypothetical protein